MKRREREAPLAREPGVRGEDRGVDAMHREAHGAVRREDDAVGGEALDAVRREVDSALIARFDAAMATFEAATRASDAALCQGNEAFCRGIESMARALERETARADAAATAAELAMRGVLDRLRAGKVPRTELANIARAVTARLADIERAIADECEARDGEAGEVEAWRQRAATAARGGGDDLIAGARRIVAQRRARLLARDVEIRAYRAVADRLREIGRAVLAAAE